MKKFEVEITETLQRTVTVEAASQEEAERMVDRGWRDGDYVLTDEDYVGVDFKTTGEHELSENAKPIKKFSMAHLSRCRCRAASGRLPSG